MTLSPSQIGMARRKPGKFRNRKTTVDGVVYDSAKEARRGSELALLERAGQISGLERQVRIPIIVNGVKVCSYVADFQYVQNGRTVVEDVKSEHTRKLPLYRLKNKLLKAANGIEIVET